MIGNKYTFVYLQKSYPISFSWFLFMKSSLIYLSNINKKNNDKTIDYKSSRIKKIGVFCSQRHYCLRCSVLSLNLVKCACHFIKKNTH